MMNLFEAAWVIARRDFVATVYSRSFILFLIVPLFMFGVAFSVGRVAEESDRNASQPVVAVISDSATAAALANARERLAGGTAESVLPILRTVAPAEDLSIQAGRLLADENAGFSAVFSGTLARPVLTGPAKINDNVGARMELIVDDARRATALEGAGALPPQVSLHRVVTEQAAGNLQMIRRNVARLGQGLIFLVTLLLATLLLSNLAEEKTNKVIEVLAAAVPLDAVFLGKLIAMLGISLVGLSLWGGTLGLAYLFVQVVQDWVTVPQAGPAIGWSAFLVLLLIYYIINYMLLGALFLGIGGQASNIREIQTLSMPVTMLQVFVFLIAMNVVGKDGGVLMWVAYFFPFSSPLAMVAHAAQYDSWWPHLVALVWQLTWIVLTIRVSARLFRLTVLKSAPSGAFFNFRALLGRQSE
jgi:ABC-2 type transport system permease protein